MIDEHESSIYSTRQARSGKAALAVFIAVAAVLWWFYGA